MGTFLFRWPHAANEVYVTGTFDDWGKTERLEKVGSVFEKEVTLSSADEKILYKFVVDDQWIVDHEAPQEGDGHHNVNNVLHPEQIQKHSRSDPTSQSLDGSHHGGMAAGAVGGLAAGGAGAAMLSSAHPQSTTSQLAGNVPKEPAFEQSRTAPQDSSVEPASQGAGSSMLSSAHPQSTSAALAGDVSKEPASEQSRDMAGESGFDNKSSGVDAGMLSIADPQSSTAQLADDVFTEPAFDHGRNESKGSAPGAFPEDEPDDERAFGVQPIPASSGIGNPVSLPAGEKVPEPSSVTPHTVTSTATTSKEDYDRDASAPLFAGGAGAGLAGLGQREAEKDGADGSAFSVPETSKNMIPESSLPMGGSMKDTTDTGPMMSSAAPTATSAYMMSTIPFEPKREATVVDEDETPSATLSGPAPAIPEMVKESLAESHQSPEAAAVPEAVQEKTEMERELMEKVQPTNATGESAPTGATGSAESAREPTQDSSIYANDPASTADGATESSPSAGYASAPPGSSKGKEHLEEGAGFAAAGTAVAAGSAAATSKHGDTSATTADTMQPAPHTAQSGMTSTGSAMADSQAPHSTSASSTTAAGAASGSSNTGLSTTGTAGTGSTTTQTKDTSPLDQSATPKVSESQAMSSASLDPKTTTTASTSPATPAKTATGATAPASTSATSSPASTATDDQKKKNRKSFFGKLKNKLKDL